MAVKKRLKKRTLTDAEQGQANTLFESIITDIDQGFYDNWLREVAKACHNRAVAIGEAKPRGQAKAEEKVAQHGRTERLNRTEVVASPDRMVVFPVKPTTDSPALNNFEVNGKRYYRKDFIGRTFVIQPGDYPKTSKYDGELVKITGAGSKAFKIDFATPNGATAFTDEKTGSGVGYIFYDKVPRFFG